MRVLLFVFLAIFFIVGVSFLQVFLIGLIGKFKKKPTQFSLSPGTIICTSATKPIPGEAGEKVYEVDTNKFFVSDGWRWLPARVKK